MTPTAAQLVSRVETAIVRAVASLAGDLGLSCVAEGIEHPDQRAFLADLGVLAQGYLLARPAPPEVVTELLLRQPLAARDRR